MSKNPAIKLNIIPDSDVIDTFDSNDGTTIPNESYTITGTVELCLAYPIQLRQLQIRFKGTAESIISIYGYSNTFEDEPPIEKWYTVDPNKLVDRIARKTQGLTSATSNLIDVRCDILDRPRVIDAGKTCWPFSINIRNVHCLPATTFLPYHLIQYTLSAKVKLNSLGERMKLAFWNTRMNIGYGKKAANHGYITPPSSPVRINNTSPCTLVTSPFTSPTLSNGNYYYDENTDMSDSAPHTDSSNNSLYSINSSRIKNNPSNKRNLFGVYKNIRICRHTYPSIYALHNVPRLKYRGSRKGRFLYEVGMPKFTCLQKKAFPFDCVFTSLSDDVKVDTLEFFLEQIETYPVKAGDYSNAIANNKISSKDLVQRVRKFSRTKHSVPQHQNEDGTDILKFSLSLSLPHISSQVQTEVLKITHKLRVIIRFVNSSNHSKERNMSLSFPLNIGTVPSVRLSIDNSLSTVIAPAREMVSSQNNNPIHVQQEFNQWLLTSDYCGNSDSLINDSNKLPSYCEALREGNPPSPFLEDSI